MRLFEAIMDANHRALAGDDTAGLRPSEFAGSLPVVALTCIDPRLNPLMPEVLGIPEEKFIWLRNAGNIITGPSSSTMRSLALACVVKGGREIAIIGHSDCLVRKTSVLELTTGFKALGIERSQLPENLNEYFGLFASERQNVLRGVEFIRSSPLIGRSIPVHGLMVDIESGRLEWLVNGYQVVESGPTLSTGAPAPPLSVGNLTEPGPVVLGESNVAEPKIGELPAVANEFLSGLRLVETKESPPPPPPRPPPARPIPVPPPIRVAPRPTKNPRRGN